MDENEAKEYLRSKNIVRDIEDDRSYIEIADQIINFGSPAVHHEVELELNSDTLPKLSRDRHYPADLGEYKDE